MTVVWNDRSTLADSRCRVISNIYCCFTSRHLDFARLADLPSHSFDALFDPLSAVWR